MPLALALLVLLAGCASQQPPPELVAVDRLVNDRPYMAMTEGPGFWDLPLDRVNCAGYAAWKWALLRLKGLPATIIVFQPDHGQAHAIVKSGDWILDSIGPSPRPWKAPEHGYWETGLEFNARWANAAWRKK